MKKIIFLFVLTALISTSMAQKPYYEITGNIEGAEGVKFILQSSINGKMVNLDTAVVKNGMFKITGGSVEYPEIVNLVTMDRKNGLSFYLENSKIIISGKLESLNEAKITGSKTQDEIYSLSEFLKPLGEKYRAKNSELQAAGNAGDTTRVNILKIQLNNLMSEAKAFEIEFIKNNPGSFASPEILLSIVSDMQATEIEAIINAMDPSVARTPMIVDLRRKVSNLKIVDIGKKAPDFTMNDPKGNKVSLSSKIGPKLLLIDFWAAWCAPCRAENPNVVKVYNEFHEKGFDILGVSLDQSGEMWNKAITDDRLTWTHVSDLQFWNNAAAKLYLVNSIPANFLLDKNGIIVAKNLRGEELRIKVKELINSK